MSKVKQNTPTAPGVLQPVTPPAPRTIPVPPAAPGTTRSSAAATSPSNKPLAGPAGRSQSHTIGASDVGAIQLTLGNRSYNLQEHLGRNIEQSDIGHTVMDSYTADGWVLSFS